MHDFRLPMITPTANKSTLGGVDSILDSNPSQLWKHMNKEEQDTIK